MRVMEGSEGEQDRTIAGKLIYSLPSKGVDGIIPGFTELPLLLGKEMESDDIVNPARFVAEASVKYAIE